MHSLRPSALLALLLTACGSSDSGTTANPETGSTADTTAATTTDGTSHETHVTGETGSETTAPTTGTTHATHDTHDTSSGHDTHDTSGHDTTAATTGGGDSAGDYCACMLLNCHDQYHGTWGEEHPDSENMCMAAAEAVPSVGMPAMSGNSIECRLYFCQLGHDDPSACDTALGAAPCL